MVSWMRFSGVKRYRGVMRKLLNFFCARQTWNENFCTAFKAKFFNVLFLPSLPLATPFNFQIFMG